MSSTHPQSSPALPSYPVVLFDGPAWESLLPLTYTRPSAYLRVGMHRLVDKWNNLGVKVLIHTKPHLTPIFGDAIPDGPCLFVAGNALVSNNLLDLLSTAQIGDRFSHNEDGIVFCGDKADFEVWLREPDSSSSSPFTEWQALQSCADIFTQTAAQIEHDLRGHSVSDLPDGANTLFGERLYLDEGASIKASIINTETGPVHLGRNAQIMEGCMVRGPLTLGEGAVLKMGAKVYGPVSIGPHSKVGGEIGSSSIQGYSNKGHDGYLGNSVLGEWCNLGADTNTSNLKNNYGEVKVWNYRSGSVEGSGLQFHGLVMGDHSKCSINTMFNTGTVVGVSANIFGHGFPEKFVPSFRWGANDEYNLEKAMKVAEAVMARRKVELGPNEKALLKAVFEMSARYRSI